MTLNVFQHPSIGEPVQIEECILKQVQDGEEPPAILGPNTAIAIVQPRTSS